MFSGLTKILKPFGPPVSVLLIATGEPANNNSKVVTLPEPSTLLTLIVALLLRVIISPIT